jgi:nucleoside 2-deoxyribosyltransferase
MKIYLAGPDVFLPDAIEIGRRKAAICARHGVHGLYPLDNAVDLSAADASLAIFRGNQAMMDAGRDHRQPYAVSRPQCRRRHRL